MTKTTLLFTTALVALAGCNEDDKGTLDVDGDGFSISDDCDDANPTVNPDALEVCDDGIDNNCDGVDESCVVDADGDGSPAGEDCDDTDPNVYPTRAEDCFNEIDDNCDGVATECLDPVMEWELSRAGLGNIYSTAVFADQIVFGVSTGSGTVRFFEYEPGVITGTDAVTELAGDTPGFGFEMGRTGNRLCIHGHGAFDDLGKSSCFTLGAVRGEVGTLVVDDAEFSLVGEVVNGFAAVEEALDVNADGFEDLLVYTSRQLHAILGDGTPWSGEYAVPSGTDVTLGTCDGLDSISCGFGRAVLTESPGVILVAGDGTDDNSAWFDLPLVGSTPSPDVDYAIERYDEDSSAPVPSLSGFAVGNSSDSSLTLIDGGGDTTLVDGPDHSAFGSWSATGEDQEGNPLLLVSALEQQDTNGTGVGTIYVFDLNLTPLPTSSTQARYILTPPHDLAFCGWRTDIGQVSSADGIRTLISSTCAGYGAAVYELDFTITLPLPLPPQAIVQVGPRRFEIKEQAVNLYTANPAWLRTLAQTEKVNGGWRLHAIEPGSPLDRMRFQDGDAVLSVNDYPLNTPAQVQAAAMGLMDASVLRVDVRRGGNVQRVRYEIVP